jgi:hypothetical protein
MPVIFSQFFIFNTLATLLLDAIPFQPCPKTAFSPRQRKAS